MNIKLRRRIIEYIKNKLGIEDWFLFVQKKKQKIEKFIYRKKYTSKDIVEVLKQNGIQPGRPVFVHSAMGFMFNYLGTADELIDTLLDYIGPEGTLCMPAYPFDKFNSAKVFNVLLDKTEAGYLAETFRKRDGVIRSMNKLHSVCALGKDAVFLTNEHHKSTICFDKYSPYYKATLLGGYTVNFGMPRWFIGTVEHVCEALLFDKVSFFHEKFDVVADYIYVDCRGNVINHRMNAKSSKQYKYQRNKSKKFIKTYFDQTKYSWSRLSNIWISTYDMKYVVQRLTELALQGITIYRK